VRVWFEIIVVLDEATTVLCVGYLGPLLFRMRQ